jgi:hypothetical protein
VASKVAVSAGPARLARLQALACWHVRICYSWPVSRMHHGQRTGARWHRHTPTCPPCMTQCVQVQPFNSAISASSIQMAANNVVQSILKAAVLHDYDSKQWMAMHTHASQQLIPLLPIGNIHQLDFIHQTSSSTAPGPELFTAASTAHSSLTVCAGPAALAAHLCMC